MHQFSTISRALQIDPARSCLSAIARGLASNLSACTSVSRRPPGLYATKYYFTVYHNQLRGVGG